MAFEGGKFLLEQCLDALIDYRGKTPRKVGSGVPLVTAKVVKNGRIDPPGEFIAESQYFEWMTRGFPEIGDVVLTTEAPLGEVGQIQSVPVALAQRVVTLRGKRGMLDNSYLLYLLQSDAMQSKLRDRSTGTTVIGIKQSELRKVELELPPISDQHEIGSALKAFDDRIDNLRQTNTTLEAIAQALFKSWFVDFDPVRAKAEGREPEGMDATTAALFPSEFQKSELGPIPKGWRVGSSDELVEIIGGGTPKTAVDKYWGGAVPWFSVVDAPAAGQVFTLKTAKKITGLGLASCSAKLLPPMTTIISARGTVGKVAMAAVPMATNQSCYALRPRCAGGEAFIYLSTLRFVEQLQQIAHGAVFDTITHDSFKRITVCLPSEETIVAFGMMVNPLLERIRTNGFRAINLAELRATLLPHLILGRLRFSETESITQTTSSGMDHAVD